MDHYLAGDRACSDSSSAGGAMSGGCTGGAGGVSLWAGAGGGVRFRSVTEKTRTREVEVDAQAQQGGKKVYLFISSLDTEGDSHKILGKTHFLRR